MPMRADLRAVRTGLDGFWRAATCFVPCAHGAVLYVARVALNGTVPLVWRKSRNIAV